MQVSGCGLERRRHLAPPARRMGPEPSKTSEEETVPFRQSRQKSPPALVIELLREAENPKFDQKAP